MYFLKLILGALGIACACFVIRAAILWAQNLEIKFWKDTGTPRFRIWFCRCDSTYKWIFKVMSFYTLWVAYRRP